MNQLKKDDLINKQLDFTLYTDANEGGFRIFKNVCDGKITSLNEHYKQLSKQNRLNEFEKLIKSLDPENKTLLSYAWY